jgi:branched-chain amino acid transport system permease protein
MVYGILRLINFAHGEIVMLAAYFAFYGVAIFLLPWWITFPLAILCSRPGGHHHRAVGLQAAAPGAAHPAFYLGGRGSFLLENLGIVIFGGRPKAFQRPAFLDINLQIGQTTVISYTPAHHRHVPWSCSAR